MINDDTKRRKATLVTWKSEARSWKPSGRFPRMRRNKLIFAGEKKVASHSPAGVLLSKVDTAPRRFWKRMSACCRGVGVTLAGPTNPHAVATEPSATAITSSFMGEREREQHVRNDKQKQEKTSTEAPCKTRLLHAKPRSRTRGGGGLSAFSLQQNKQ